MSEPYFLIKNGLYYAHNDAGYTARFECAEVYTKEHAEAYAERSGGEVRAKALSEIYPNPEMGQKHIESLNHRMKKMLDFFKQQTNEG